MPSRDGVQTMLHSDALIDWDQLCKCGHKAIDHHGVDGGRINKNSGCQTRVMFADWCRCALTATEVVNA